MKQQKLNTDKVLQILQPNGLLSTKLWAFEARQEQQQMLLNVIDAYHHNAISLIEAGTGTGKSIAYLLPALLWALTNQERTVISTNTIALQEQLVSKDIPLLIEALQLNVKAVLVKGMSNYLCLRKLSDAHYELNLLPPNEANELQQIEGWKNTTQDGSRTDLPFIPSQAAWDRVSAEADACSHTKCPHYNDCFFFKARKKAAEAQIIVANHHLLFADLKIRAENDNYEEVSILPPYKRLIIDEAHHIEDVATEHFASRVSRIQMMRILAQIASEKQGKTFGKIPALRQRLMEFHLASSTKEPELEILLKQLNIDMPAERRDLLQQIAETFQAYAAFLDHLHHSENSEDQNKLRLLDSHRKHPVWNDEIIPFTEKLLTSAKRYVHSLLSLEKQVKGIKGLNEKVQGQVSSLIFDIKAFALRLETCITTLHDFLLTDTPPSKVRWIESEQLNTLTNTRLINADLEISKLLYAHLFTKFSTIVLCSATLSTNRHFEFIKDRLGLKLLAKDLKAPTEHIYDSPFHYQAQALLLVPSDMPHPNDPSFISAAADKIWEAIQASRGNAFILFTSYGMLKNCYQLLSQRMEQNRFIAFKQGDDHRSTLLDKFKNTDRSVLFGTDSFWEGVDVAGDALRCVIIVKLPFKVPSEPIIQARTEALSARGQDPFLHYSVPNAIVKFKQGFGRLIRNKKDRGCVICLDNRLIAKGYGKLFLNSLPPCQQLIIDGDKFQEAMKEFYRKTYHLVAKQGK